MQMAATRGVVIANHRRMTFSCNWDANYGTNRTSRKNIPKVSKVIQVTPSHQVFFILVGIIAM